MDQPIILWVCPRAEIIDLDPSYWRFCRDRLEALYLAAGAAQMEENFLLNESNDEIDC